MSVRSTPSRSNPLTCGPHRRISTGVPRQYHTVPVSATAHSTLHASYTWWATGTFVLRDFTAYLHEVLGLLQLAHGLHQRVTDQNGHVCSGVAARNRTYIQASSRLVNVPWQDPVHSVSQLLKATSCINDAPLGVATELEQVCRNGFRAESFLIKQIWIARRLRTRGSL